jgi:hypothetical protein
MPREMSREAMADDAARLYVTPALAERIADQLATVARASCLLSEQAGQILAGGAVVSRSTLTSLEELLVVLRPAVQVRSELAALDPDLLLAGAHVWLARRPATARPPAPSPCGVGGRCQAEVGR